MSVITRNRLLLFAAIVGLIFALYLSVKIKKSPCEKPTKIGAIPASAKWIGDCDGGKWFDIVNIENEDNIYTIGIYYDNDGKLIVEKEFHANKNCNTYFKTKEELLSSILDYDFYAIETKYPNCNLIPTDDKTE